VSVSPNGSPKAVVPEGPLGIVVTVPVTDTVSGLLFDVEIVPETGTGLVFE
jgi:hypothetical protein